MGRYRVHDRAGGDGAQHSRDADLTRTAVYAYLHELGAIGEGGHVLALLPTQDPTWAFLSEMHELGFKTAGRWVADNLDAVGTRSSLDLSRFAGTAGNTRTGTLTA